MSKFLFADLRQPIERRIYQPFSGLKLRSNSHGSFPVPWADVLTDVATEDMPSHALAQTLWNCTPFLDRQIGNAAVGIELVWCDECLSWTCINAACTCATAIRRWQIRDELERSENHSEE